MRPVDEWGCLNSTWVCVCVTVCVCVFVCVPPAPAGRGCGACGRRMMGLPELDLGVKGAGAFLSPTGMYWYVCTRVLLCTSASLPTPLSRRAGEAAGTPGMRVCNCARIGASP